MGVRGVQKERRGHAVKPVVRPTPCSSRAMARVGATAVDERDERRHIYRIVEQNLEAENGSHRGQPPVCWGHYEYYTVRNGEEGNEEHSAFPVGCPHGRCTKNWMRKVVCGPAESRSHQLNRTIHLSFPLALLFGTPTEETEPSSWRWWRRHACKPVAASLCLVANECTE